MSQGPSPCSPSSVPRTLYNRAPYYHPLLTASSSGSIHLVAGCSCFVVAMRTTMATTQQAPAFFDGSRCRYCHYCYFADIFARRRRQYFIIWLLERRSSCFMLLFLLPLMPENK